MTEVLAQITAPHFCAGLVLKDDVVSEAAPIIKYMVGWSRDKVRNYTRHKNWKARIIK